MRPNHVQPSARSARRPRRRLAAGAVAASLLFVACGGESDSSGDGEALPEADVEADAGSTGEATPVAAGAGYVDLVGPDVVATAEIDTNVLPNVVVDDLTNGRKVNFRNLVPQDKPVLLWMYAPH